MEIRIKQNSMNLLEKEQRVEAIKMIVWARWYSVAIIVVLGVLLKTEYYGGIWGNYFDLISILAMGVLAFSYNLCFWLYLRRPVEKMSDKTLGIVAALQVILDQLLYTLIYYSTGTVESIASLLYFLTVLFASSLYKTKGIILTGILAVFLYSGATLADYYKLVPHVYPFHGETSWFGNALVARVKITGFIFYTGVAVFFSSALSSLFRKREKNLIEQKDQLLAKTQTLTSLTEELGEIKSSLEIRIQARTKELQESTEKLEEQVGQRTRELRSKITELEKFNRLAIGRELKMAELKKEIAGLQEQLFKKKRGSK